MVAHSHCIHSTCMHSYRREDSPLDFSDPLSVFPLFGLLVSPVGISETVTRCVRVENPYIKKCILVVVPEASCTNIGASMVACVYWSGRKELSSEGLEGWLRGLNFSAHAQKCWKTLLPWFLRQNHSNGNCTKVADLLRYSFASAPGKTSLPCPSKRWSEHPLHQAQF